MGELAHVLLPIFLQHRLHAQDRADKLKADKEQRDLHNRLLDLQTQELQSKIDNTPEAQALKKKQIELAMANIQSEIDARKSKATQDTPDERKAQRSKIAMDQMLSNSGMTDEDLKFIATKDVAKADPAQVQGVRDRMKESVNKLLAAQEYDFNGKPKPGGLHVSTQEERDALLGLQHSYNSRLDEIAQYHAGAVAKATDAQGRLKAMGKEDKFSKDIYAGGLPQDSLMLKEGRNYLQQVFSKVDAGQEGDLQQAPLRQPGVTESGIQSETQVNRAAQGRMIENGPAGSVSNMGPLYQRRFASQVSGGQEPTGLTLNPSLRPLQALAQTPSDLRQLAQSWQGLNEKDRNAVTLHLLFGQYLDPEKRAQNLDQLRQTLGLVKPLQDTMQGQQGAPQALPGPGGAAGAGQMGQMGQMGQTGPMGIPPEMAQQLYQGDNSPQPSPWAGWQGPPQRMQ